MDTDDWLWPLRGWTWKERLLAFMSILELVFLATAFYCCAWALASY